MARIRFHEVPKSGSHSLLTCWCHFRSSCLAQSSTLLLLTEVVLVRSLSEAQESAQMLTGLDMPNSVLYSLLTNAKLPAGNVGVVNLSPYDGCLETCCSKYHLKDEANSERRFLTLSVGFDMEPLTFSERLLGIHFMQD